MEDHIGTEKVVHGQQWGTLHGGYFSDPAIAQSLIEAAKEILAKSPADVVVDLGGGTGFLLNQLASHKIGAGVALVNVDCSEAQLDLIDENIISSVCTSIGEFRRSAIASEQKRCFFLMRSVLHYLGENGVTPLLRHLRHQAGEGEFFLHQSASFDNEEDAACLNALYRHMRTHKWYPTVNDLKERLVGSGWRVTATAPAPTLLLTSDDLGRRYALDTNDLIRIRDTMAREFGETNSVFQITSSGFQASLHYNIYTCEAVPF
jgi:cyclopropane fatty-acyl-phospholipid synthase-like methyltransferase